ncbi:MAG: DUF2017 family protein [Actinobacteria bacterium]|nr:DUF2017 family protein [Actinomycetota bacterium]
MGLRRNRSVVGRTSKGYVLRLSRDEIDLIVRLLDELRALMLSDDPETAPLMRRLFPPAYHLQDDAEAEAEYQRLMREDLVASHLESIGRVETALNSGEPMNDSTVQGFMQALNGVRLVLGTLLDVSEEHDLTSVRDDHPMAAEHHLYGFLSYLLESTVLAVSR